MSKTGVHLLGPPTPQPQVILKAGIGRRKLLVKPVLKGDA